MEIRSSGDKQKTDSPSEDANPLLQETYRSEPQPYYDRSDDLVAGVRAAKLAAQREMEAFGDVSEYDVTIIQGRLKDSETAAEPADEPQS